MIEFTLALTAGTIGATVVSDHVRAVRRHSAHMVFLYAAMMAVLVAFALADARGLLG